MTPSEDTITEDYQPDPDSDIHDAIRAVSAWALRRDDAEGGE
jgi:hypothetical protein